MSSVRVCRRRDVDFPSTSSGPRALADEPLGHGLLEERQANSLLSIHLAGSERTTQSPAPLHAAESHWPRTKESGCLEARLPLSLGGEFPSPATRYPLPAKRRVLRRTVQSRIVPGRLNLSSLAITSNGTKVHLRTASSRFCFLPKPMKSHPFAKSMRSPVVLVAVDSRLL